LGKDKEGSRLEEKFIEQIHIRGNMLEKMNKRQTSAREGMLAATGGNRRNQHEEGKATRYRVAAKEKKK